MEKRRPAAGLDGRREVLRGSADSRAVRARSEIKAALERLAGLGQEITVSALVREAGIGRGTFYTYYSGLEDLAVELQAEVVHSLAGLERTAAHLDPDRAMVTRRETIAEALGGVVEHYGNYRTFYSAVFSMPLSQSAAQIRVDALAAELQEHMEVDAVVPEGVSIRMAALFIAGGWTTVINDWILGRLRASEDEVTAHLVWLVPEWLFRLRVRPSPE